MFQSSGFLITIHILSMFYKKSGVWGSIILLLRGILNFDDMKGYTKPCKYLEYSFLLYKAFIMNRQNTLMLLLNMILILKDNLYIYIMTVRVKNQFHTSDEVAANLQLRNCNMDWLSNSFVCSKVATHDVRHTSMT